MALNKELLSPSRGVKGMGSNAVGVIVALSLLVLVCMIYQPDPSSFYFADNKDCVSTSKESPLSTLTSEGSGTATSGRLFLGKPIRTLPDHIQRRFVGKLKKSQQAGENKKWINPDHFCKQWSVVTTIFEPSDAVKVQGKLGGGWCLVVVGDNKGPFEYPLPEFNTDGKFIFLDAEKQKEMFDSFELGSIVPWGHFGRKTFGYLYAIAHGAKLVWDFDDDNMLRTKNPVSIKVPDSTPNTTVYTTHDTINCKSFNPYPAMGTKYLPSWPRGLPLEDIKDEACQVKSEDLKEQSIPTANIAIYQSLANHDPDVDAIYRLTQPLPFEFDDPQKRSVMIPTTTLSPFNAQATLFTYDALFLLLLPISVHGRVSDIWRSYYAQRLLLDCKKRIVFTPPQVDQYRNAHNYLADIDSELDLYKKSGKLVEFLSREWAPEKPTDSIPSRWEQMAFELYKRDYIGVKDIELVQAWIQQLVDIEYDFPKIAV